MEFEKIKITDIKPCGYNPRMINDNEFSKLQNSISEFGVVDPIIINLKNNHIIGGHQRYDVLLDKYMSEGSFLEELHLLRLGDVGWVFPDTDLEIKSDDHEKALNLALNKISGEWDEVKLAPLLDDLSLKGFDIELTGFDKPELAELNFNEDEPAGENKRDIDTDYNVIEDEHCISEDITVNVEFGDIFKLGEHVLMCGDSTNPQDLDRLINDTKINLLLTDPPYGMKKEKEGVHNDNLNQEDLLSFNKKWINLALNYMDDIGSGYIFGMDEVLMDIYSHILKPLIKENKVTFRNLLTWDKKTGFGQLSKELRMYSIADEKILFFMMGVQGFNNNKDNYFEGWEPIRQYLLQSRLAMGWDVPTMKKIVGHSDINRDHWTDKSQFCLIPEYAYKMLQEEAEKQRKEKRIGNDAFKREYDDIKREYDAFKREYYATRAYFNNTHDNMNNVWHFDRTTQKERQNTGGHATPKPLKLLERPILSSSRKKDTILDLFGGSGSTLIACEQTDRKCYMMEIDPYYCQIIINRWEEFTGKKAEKTLQILQ